LLGNRFSAVSALWFYAAESLELRPVIVFRDDAPGLWLATGNDTRRLKKVDLYKAWLSFFHV
jgi:hypothetical protein